MPKRHLRLCFGRIVSVARRESRQEFCERENEEMDRTNGLRARGNVAGVPNTLLNVAEQMSDDRETWGPRIECSSRDCYGVYTRGAANTQNGGSTLYYNRICISICLRISIHTRIETQTLRK